MVQAVLTGRLSVDYIRHWSWLV